MQQQIQVTDDLVIELWPAAPGDSADRPLLKLRSLAAGRDGEDRAVVVYLDEAKSLVAALVDAAVQLAEAETRHAKRNPA
jgi:hypothetical protein